MKTYLAVILFFAFCIGAPLYQMAKQTMEFTAKIQSGQPIVRVRD